MRNRVAAVQRLDWLERAVAAALVVLALATVNLAVRLGAAGAAGEADLLAEMRARTERRVAAERSQIQPFIEALSRTESAASRRAGEAALAGLPGNSQLHLLLAGVYRADGAAAPALREYRRAVELLRDYADRRSPQFIGVAFAHWLRSVRPGVSGVALRDLHFLERALAGGCS